MNIDKINPQEWGEFTRKGGTIMAIKSPNWDVLSQEVTILGTNETLKVPNGYVEIKQNYGAETRVVVLNKEGKK